MQRNYDASARRFSRFGSEAAAQQRQIWGAGVHLTTEQPAKCALIRIQAVCQKYHAQTYARDTTKTQNSKLKVKEVRKERIFLLPHKANLQLEGNVPLPAGSLNEFGFQYALGCHPHPLLVPRLV